MLVRLTQSHIDAAQADRNNHFDVVWSCPMARALTGAMGCPVAVGDKVFRWDGGCPSARVSYPLPKEAVLWVHRWDHFSKRVAPEDFEFEGLEKIQDISSEAS
jgi:hypothetical protein